MSDLATIPSDQISGEPKRNKRQKFVQLAERRTINAIKAIRTIAKLGNHAHYTYSEYDVKKIVSALNKETEALKIKMTSNGAKETVNFKL